jgi:hypothetical protein
MILEVASLVCAVVPAGIFCANLRFYTPPPPADSERLPTISILIPARNEEAGIAACVEAALASTGAQIEVVVMDDNSTDRTAEIVRGLAASLTGTNTLRLEYAPPLPPSWNGKQHACWELAHAATGEILCFVDADVRLAPDAVKRMASFLRTTESGLVSGFPRQITVTWLEQLLLPLIHFVLLGFLPLFQARKTANPGYAAGCGQFLMLERHAYFAAGGHAGIRSTMHDGIKLPRLLREAGFHTDLADLTTLASCRMYTTARQVWSGLAKNATEGMASAAAIVPATLFLVLGQVVPFLLLRFAVLHHLSRAETVVIIPAVAAAWLPRVLSIRRFRQPVLSALLHPLGIVALLVLQWYALLRTVAGARVTWKSRAYTAG